MATLNFDDYTAGAMNTPPAGWIRPATSQQTQIVTGSGVEYFSAASGNNSTQMGVWVHGTPITGNTIYAKTTIPVNLTQNGANGTKMVLLNSGGDGYAFWISQDGLTVRIYLVVDCVTTTMLAERTGFGAGLNTEFEIRASDKSSGTFKILRAGVQLGADIIDTTYTGIEYSGASSSNTNGKVKNITTGAIQDWTSFTDPVVMGSAVSAVTSGFSTVTSITAAEMSAVGVSFNSGTNTTTATWPAVAEGLVSTIALPATNVTFTISDGSGGTDTLVSDIDLAANDVSVQVGTPIAGAAYFLTAYPTLASGWDIHYDQTQLGGLTIYPDGLIEYTNNGTFTAYVHQLGDDNAFYQVNVTVDNGVVLTAPVMPADTSVAVVAGSTAFYTFAATSGTPPITYTQSGASTALFTTNSSTGVATFNAPAVLGASGSLIGTATNAQGSDSQTVTFTVIAPPDITPDNVTFETLSAVSSIETITGLDDEAVITVTGGQYRINGGSYTSAAGVVSNGDTVQLSSANGDTVVVTIGAKSFSWSSSGGSSFGQSVIGLSVVGL